MATLPERPESLNPDKDPFEGWDKVPLFMQSLPDASDDPKEKSSSIALDALQSLMYEGTPEETAQSLKETANEYFRGKEYRKALSFYEQALKELGKDLSIETKRLLWANCAACNLELKNYGSTLRDCAKVLSSGIQDQTSLKALYRSAVALDKLEKFEDSVDAIERWNELNLKLGGGLKKGSDAAIKKLQVEVERRWKASRDYKESVARKKAEEEAARQLLLAEVKTRQLLLPKTFDASFPLCPTDISPPSYSLQGGIGYPVFLLSPFATPPTRDLIVSFLEETSFTDQLPSEILETVGIFGVTKKRRILKLGKKTVLRKLIESCWKDGDGLELKDGWCLEFYLVPKGKEKAWSEEMKKD